MYNPIVVRVGRKNVFGVSLGGDISSVPIGQWKSQIRVSKSLTSPLIADFEVTFATDGTDGNLVLTLTSAATANIKYSSGWMDIRKIEDSEPISVFESPIKVEFEGVVTET